VDNVEVQLERVNCFGFDEGWLARRRRTLGIVRAALAGSHAGGNSLKVVSTRYGAGLQRLGVRSVGVLAGMLEEYEAAVDEANVP
jgi:hypothetical protein